MKSIILFLLLPFGVMCQDTVFNKTLSEMETLSKPMWINGWTRFPNKGF